MVHTDCIYNGVLSGYKELKRLLPKDVATVMSILVQHITSHICGNAWVNEPSALLV